MHILVGALFLAAGLAIGYAFGRLDSKKKKD